MNKLFILSLIIFIVLLIISVICFKKLITFDINNFVDNFFHSSNIIFIPQTIIKEKGNDTCLLKENLDSNFVCHKPTTITINNKEIQLYTNESYKDNIVDESILHDLLQPVNYYKNIKGKNIRSILTNQLGVFFGIDKKIIDFIAETNETLHNASLVVDDIQDNSLTRRQHPCSHIVYGIPYSIGAAYLQLFKYLFDMTNIDNIVQNIDYSIFKEHEQYKNLDIETIKIMKKNEIMRITIENIYKVHIGQELDVYWAYKHYIPSIDEYKKMVQYKTGILFINNLDYLHCITPNIVNELYNEYYDKLMMLSLFFQIRDDYINITDIEYWKIKGFCEDFDEKKNSYVIIKYMNNENVCDDEKESFNELFYKRNLTNDEKIILLNKINKTDVFETIFNELDEYKKKISENIIFNVIFDLLPYKKFELDTSLEKYNDYIENNVHITE